MSKKGLKKAPFAEKLEIRSFIREGSPEKGLGTKERVGIKSRPRRGKKTDEEKEH